MVKHKVELSLTTKDNAVEYRDVVEISGKDLDEIAAKAQAMILAYANDRVRKKYRIVMENEPVTLAM